VNRLTLTLKTCRYAVGIVTNLDGTMGAMIQELKPIRSRLLPIYKEAYIELERQGVREKFDLCEGMVDPLNALMGYHSIFSHSKKVGKHVDPELRSEVTRKALGWYVDSYKAALTLDKLLGNSWELFEAENAQEDDGSGVPHELPKQLVKIVAFFIPRKRREALLGDWLEEYQDHYHQYGRKYADTWLSKEVFMSLWPLVRAWLTSLGSLHYVHELLKRISR